MKHVSLPALQVDELAQIKADIAILQVREKALVDALKATGMDRIIGTLHEATISLSERQTIDTKALREDHPKIAAQYTRSTDVTTLKIVGRK